jgi:hypothetical protein
MRGADVVHSGVARDPEQAHQPYRIRAATRFIEDPVLAELRRSSGLILIPTN